MEEKTIKPSRAFIKKLYDLTECNAHTACYKAVAAWCEKNVADVNEQVRFHMFWKMFDAMEAAHEYLGNFPHCEMRYEVGKDMDYWITKDFGEKVLEEINKGR